MDGDQQRLEGQFLGGRKGGVRQGRGKRILVGKTAQAQAWRERRLDACDQTRNRCIEATASPNGGQSQTCPVDLSWEEGQRGLGEPALSSDTPGRHQATLHPQPQLWPQPSELLEKLQSFGNRDCSSQSKNSTVTLEDRKCQPVCPWVAQDLIEPECSQEDPA